MSTKNQTQSGRSFFVVLFGLPFLLAGLFILYLATSWWIDYFAIGSWERVPMDIVSVEFKEYSGEDSDSYKVLCNYAYTFKEKSYKGDRVNIESGSSGSSRHEERYEQILEYKNAGRKFIGLVNPDNPNHAIMYREVGMGMILMIPFGLIFAAVGAGISGGSLYAMFKGKKA